MVAIYVGNSIQSYSSGIYTDVDGIGQTVNHAVVVEGIPSILLSGIFCSIQQVMTWTTMGTLSGG